MAAVTPEGAPLAGVRDRAIPTLPNAAPARLTTGVPKPLQSRIPNACFHPAVPAFASVDFPGVRNAG